MPRARPTSSRPGSTSWALAAVIALGLLFLTAVRVAQAVAGSREGLGGVFIASLIPIALAYTVAHYFTSLINDGQFAILLVSDPFGKGWDLFGTSDFSPARFDSPNGIWYVQVGVLIVGHVLGLTLAHDRAVAIWGSARTAARTQYAMLALMVLYTARGCGCSQRTEPDRARRDDGPGDRDRLGRADRGNRACRLGRRTQGQALSSYNLAPAGRWSAAFPL
jgi:hypothetical protein